MGKNDNRDGTEWNTLGAGEPALAGELKRVLDAGRHRVGALLVAREPLPGTDATTRVLSAVIMREHNAESIADLGWLIVRLRQVAEQLEAINPPGRRTVTEQLAEALESAAFYDLMQAYRRAPTGGQAFLAQAVAPGVSDRFEAVKAYVVGLVQAAERGQR